MRYTITKLQQVVFDLGMIIEELKKGCEGTRVKIPGYTVGDID